MRPSFRKDLVDEDEDLSNEERLIEADFEIGHFIKECTVPNATLYYTGDMVDETSFDEDEDAEDENEVGHDTENSAICDDETEEDEKSKPTMNTSKTNIRIKSNE